VKKLQFRVDLFTIYERTYYCSYHMFIILLKVVLLTSVVVDIYH